jgi:hypothetical protein
MKVVTYEGTVENGHVQLPEGVVLPEKTKVYVVIPDSPNVAYIASPRLVHREQAADFVKEVFPEKADAAL